jgi:hypothetical protein
MLESDWVLSPAETEKLREQGIRDTIEEMKADPDSIDWE